MIKISILPQCDNCLHIADLYECETKAACYAWMKHAGWQRSKTEILCLKCREKLKGVTPKEYPYIIAARLGWLREYDENSGEKGWAVADGIPICDVTDMSPGDEIGFISFVELEVFNKKLVRSPYHIYPNDFMSSLESREHLDISIFNREKMRYLFELCYMLPDPEKV